MLWRWMLNVYNRLDVVTAPSKTAAAILTREGLDVPVYPLSCGVDQRRFYYNATLDRRAWREKYGLAQDKTVFLFVGRVDGEKKLDVILHALQILERDDVQFVVAGKGAAAHSLQEQARQLGLGEQVHFTGFIPAEDLPALLNSADIFIMPSEAELLSIATLEAMSCRKPVLAAQAQALPELVSDGVNGYLFRPGDAADAARGMALLAGQAENWPAMGEASLQKVQVHSLENTLRGYEIIYERMLSGGSLYNLQTNPAAYERPGAQLPGVAAVGKRG
jgi:glycosyltransferase involved in cell wall biosynthesis